MAKRAAGGDKPKPRHVLGMACGGVAASEEENASDDSYDGFDLDFPTADHSSEQLDDGVSYNGDSRRRRCRHRWNGSRRRCWYRGLRVLGVHVMQQTTAQMERITATMPVQMGWIRIQTMLHRLALQTRASHLGAHRAPYSLPELDVPEKMEQVLRNIDDEHQFKVLQKAQAALTDLNYVGACLCCDTKLVLAKAILLPLRQRPPSG